MRINPSPIAILVLCALALPIASGSAYVLHIFGNANMDAVVDQSDIAFLKAIIEGKEKSTELADANFDGKVDAKDIAQVEKIINGTEKNLTLLDGNNLPITIKKPVERIVVEYLDNADLMQILKKTDKVVGVDLAVAKSPAEFPELSQQNERGSHAQGSGL